MKPNLVFVSLLAGNADSFYDALAHYLGTKAGLDARAIAPPSWQERAQLIERGAADVAAVCGAVYADYVRRGRPVQLLAAPVMRAARYHNQPVYFSDVVVRADAPYRSFADLRGATWAYNELASFSGFLAVQADLAEHGGAAAYFGRTLESGSHQESIQAVLAGRADLAAIDSTVLERAYQLQPDLAARLRTVHTIGPNPAPPLVLTRQIEPELVAALQHALHAMHADPAGQHLLEQAQIARFVPVDDQDYDSLRDQIALSRRVHAPVFA